MSVALPLSAGEYWIALLVFGFLLVLVSVLAFVLVFVLVIALVVTLVLLGVVLVLVLGLVFAALSKTLLPVAILNANT